MAKSANLLAVVILIMAILFSLPERNVSAAELTKKRSYPDGIAVGWPGESWITDNGFALICEGPRDGKLGEVKLLDIRTEEEIVLGRTGGFFPAITMSLDGVAYWIQADISSQSGKTANAEQLNRYSVSQEANLSPYSNSNMAAWGVSIDGKYVVRKLSDRGNREATYILADGTQVGPESWESFITPNPKRFRAIDSIIALAAPRVGNNGSFVTEFGIYNRDGKKVVRFVDHENYRFQRYYICPDGSKAAVVLIPAHDTGNSILIQIYDTASGKVDFEEMYDLGIGDRDVIGADEHGKRFYLTLGKKVLVIENGVVVDESNELFHLPLDDIRVSCDGKCLVVAGTSRVIKLNSDLDVVWESEGTNSQMFGMVTSEDCTNIVVSCSPDMFIYLDTPTE